MVKMYTTNASTEEEWFSVVLPHIAQLLEMKFDSVTHIMYVDEDNTTGFCFERGSGPSSSNMFVYAYVSGEKKNNNPFETIPSAFSSGTKFFFYSKTMDGYVFNFSGAGTEERLGTGWCLKTSTLSNEDSVCYFGLYNNTFSSEGYYNFATSGHMVTQNSAVLYNYMTNDGRYYCENLFVPIYFPSTSYHMKFTLNGKLFSSTPSNGITSMRLVVPIYESF